MAKLIDRKGETNRATNGQLMTIIAYRGAADIDVQFEDTTIVHSKTYKSFRIGQIKNPNAKVQTKINRKGEVVKHRNGLFMTIIEYRNSGDIDIQFSDNTIVKNIRYDSFKRGCVQYIKKTIEVNGKQFNTFKEACIHFGVDFERALSYRKNHKNLTDEQVISYYINRQDNFTSRCMQYGMTYEIAKKACQYRARHKEENINDEDILNMFLDYTNTIGKESFRSKCIKAGLEQVYESVCHYRQKFKNLSDEEVINNYIQSGKSIKPKSRGTLTVGNKSFNSTSEVIEYFDLKVSRSYFEKYRKEKGLDTEQTVAHFNHECYFNILGELVIPT